MNWEYKNYNMEILTLSSSYFGLMNWKQLAIDYAKQHNKELDLTTLKLNGDTITCKVK
jgi:hypothetical protein